MCVCVCVYLLQSADVGPQVPGDGGHLQGQEGQRPVLSQGDGELHPGGVHPIFGWGGVVFVILLCFLDKQFRVSNSRSEEKQDLTHAGAFSYQQCTSGSPLVLVVALVCLVLQTVLSLKYILICLFLVHHSSVL